MTGFAGFTEAALDFYEDLEDDNTKSYWAAHKQTYDSAVKAPMEALLSELEDEFGAGKVFRPYRDVRFAKDKTPYKTHQGGYVAAAAATGWYVQVSARGVMVSAGFYDSSPQRLSRARDAIADDRRGAKLEEILSRLRGADWEIGGDRLKTTPRGYDAHHPRIDLLRHKRLIVSKSYGFDPVIQTAELASMVRRDWREVRPFIEWVDDNTAA